MTGQGSGDPAIAGRFTGPFPLSSAAGPLTGRSREVARIRAVLHASRLVTVTGLPGVGKTATALAAAARAGGPGGFPDGAGVIPLGPLRKPDLLPHTVAALLNVPDRLSGDRAQELIDELRGRRTLLVLDTCDHLTGACASLVARLLDGCPGVQVLATSRSPLRLAGERLVTLDPLPLDDAAALFEARGQSVVPGFRITAPGQETVRAICQRLDRLPLAIELAAGHLAAAEPEQLLRRLRSTGCYWLGGGERKPGRHETLWTAIGWSHQLCTPGERLLWARLSVFSEPFRPADAAGVCADRNLPATVVPATLSGLASRSLLLAEAGPDGTSRYRLPRTIGGYGRAMLTRLGDHARFRRRHARWYLA